MPLRQRKDGVGRGNTREHTDAPPRTPGGRPEHAVDTFSRRLRIVAVALLLGAVAILIVVAKSRHVPGYALDPSPVTTEHDVAAAATDVAAAATDAAARYGVRSSRAARPEGPRGFLMVGLVEARNIEKTAAFFLGQLTKVVDAVVLLDDHSTDGTVETVLQLGNELDAHIEVLEMPGGWEERQEQQNRNLLLSRGRLIGGSHFVLLDYDEYISPNCAGKDGTLRRLVGRLRPGQSLLLPWVETWRSPSYQRLLPGSERPKNFLNRRQIVIFADDGKSRYDPETSLSRSLGGENGTIHTLKCPRTICPRLKEDEAHRDVHKSQACHIIEMKFLNMDNVYLKAAWYEALGRFSGAPDGTTSGGMMKYVAQVADDSSQPMVIAPLLRETQMVDLAHKTSAYFELETWRVDEILRWLDVKGHRAFDGLPTFSQIDWQVLRSGSWNPREHRVPFKKKRQLVILAAEIGTEFAAQLLLGSGAEILPPSGFSTALCHFNASIGNAEDYESRRHKCEPRYRIKPDLLVVETDVTALCFCYDVIYNELGDFEVSIIEIMSGGAWSESCLSGKSTSDIRASFLQSTRNSSLASKTFQVFYGTVLSTSGVFTLLRELDLTGPDYATLMNLLRTEHKKATACSTDAASDCGPDTVKIAKLFFSANAGRSGSKYLSKVFGTLDAPVCSEHEPLCPQNQCPGASVGMQFLRLDESYERRRNIKQPMIEKSLCSLRDHPRTYEHDNSSSELSCMSMVRVDWQLGSNLKRRLTIREALYLETNPNFKSWFHDIVYEEFGQGFDVSVIVLRRYLPAVVRSLAQIGWFSSKPNDYTWIETLESVNSPVKTTIKHKDLDSYGKLTSYLVNTEARIQWMVENYKDRFQFFNLRSETLFTSTGVLDFIENDLAFVPSAATRAIAGEQIDKRQAVKIEERVSLETVVKSVNGYLGMWQSQDHSLPSMSDWESSVAGFDYDL